MDQALGTSLKIAVLILNRLVEIWALYFFVPAKHFRVEKAHINRTLISKQGSMRRVETLGQGHQPFCFSNYMITIQFVSRKY